MARIVEYAGFWAFQVVHSTVTIVVIIVSPQEILLFEVQCLIGLKRQ